MNLDEAFNTLAGPGESEHVVDRSKFLGFAVCVDTLEEAQAFVAALRKEHYDARHVCFGLRIGRGAQGLDRSNDDGEPSRTGGYPLWQLLDGESITDALLVVVRYYGGIKLGTGGLARAYREAGRQALDAAGVLTIHPEVELDLVVPYAMVDKLQYHLGQLDTVRVADTAYAADVTLKLAIRAVAEAEVLKGLAALLQCDVDEL